MKIYCPIESFEIGKHYEHRWGRRMKIVACSYPGLCGSGTLVVERQDGTIEFMSSRRGPWLKDWCKISSDEWKAAENYYLSLSECELAGALRGGIDQPIVFRTSKNN